MLRLKIHFVDLGISLNVTPQNIYFPNSERSFQYISCVTRAKSRFPFFPRIREIAALCAIGIGTDTIRRVCRPVDFFLYLFSLFNISLGVYIRSVCRYLISHM